ncbi:Vps54-like protein-domain-containing protein [Collybia nuda]|uniref:Vps54-like protein-domain-containing protein n=1 Tax=Collybia nuda TaxID=64659 RepID=A0A9P6CPH8_9AGAR|nr:Vps54-like protein-domain-containing protein [Collybia nuda]
MSDSESITSRPVTPVSALPDLPNTARPYRFTWDPASRKPGPESVSGTTEGRGGGDYFSAQPRLGFLNTSSTATLALGALPTEWSSSRHGFHAISTVLNNPHKRQAPPKAHSSLPAVVPADLPRVRRRDFDSYLRAITPEWERFTRNSELGREGIAQIGTGPSTPRASLGSDPYGINNAATNPPSANQGRAIPSLDTVPSVFFQTKFNLGDPRIFNSVTEQDPSTSDDDTDPTALSHSLPLLEKFSHYADTVEQHLILEISRRSTSFFAALTNLHDLRSESEQCLARISELRTLLTNLDENSAKRGLEVVRREEKVANIGRVAEGVKIVGGVVEMEKVARGLVGAGQWGEALGVIEEMERLWEGSLAGREEAVPTVARGLRTSSLPEVREDLEDETGRDSEQEFKPQTELQRPRTAGQYKTGLASSIPLSALQAYSSLPEHLRELTMEIASSLSSELVNVLRVDLVERIHRGREGRRQRANLGDANNGVEFIGLDQGLRDRLRPLLQGLVRTKGLKEGMISWREVVLGEVRTVLKMQVPGIDLESEETEPPGSQQKSRAGLATHLRSMVHAEFMLFLQHIYLSFLNGVEGLQEQSQVVLDILASIDSPHKSAGLGTSTQDELSDIISSAAELSNTQVAKVIAHRADQHAALELADFLVFFNESWGFVVRCEVICRKMIVSLRGAVVSQAKAFLQTFHQARISQSAKFVEDEQWNPCEVSPSLQHITNVLVDSAVRDSPELVIKSDVDTLFSTPPPSANGATSNTNGAPPHPPPPPLSGPSNGFGANSGPGAKHLRIDERTYFAVSATTEVLALLLDYLRVVVNLSMLTTDIMSRVIEFLKAFNSRTCQVVLGAGAMRSAGLKNITAKHLALASQSLSIMSDLIPYVRETFRRHLSLKQAVMLVEFDKLKRDYQEHQYEIHSKLIAIMGDRLTAHIKSLQGIDWSVPKPGGGVNDYIEILVKETVTLHKVLSRYLSTSVVEEVMTQVFAAINHGLSEEYGKIELPHQEAKTRLLADAKYLHAKLAALKNVGTPSGMLVTVISEKSIPRPTLPTPTRSSTLHNVGSSANQRLKGLLSGKSPSFDKALPIPMRTPTPPVIPPPRTTSSPVPLSSSVNGGGVGENGGNGNAIKSTPTPPPQDRKPSIGFKQVEAPASVSDPGQGSESVLTQDVEIPSGQEARASPRPTTPLPACDASPEPVTTTTMGLDQKSTEPQDLEVPVSGAQSSSSLVEEADFRSNNAGAGDA